MRAIPRRKAGRFRRRTLWYPNPRRCTSVSTDRACTSLPHRLVAVRRQTPIRLSQITQRLEAARAGPLGIRIGAECAVDRMPERITHAALANGMDALTATEKRIDYLFVPLRSCP